jgi:hypothetical protein
MPRRRRNNGNVCKSVNTDKNHNYIDATLAKDPTKNRAEALIEIYQKMRPGEPAVLENAEEFITNSFLIPAAMTWAKSAATN